MILWKLQAANLMSILFFTLQESSKEQVQNLPSALAQLQKRVLKAEATLEQKEEENTSLREQLKQTQTKWMEYETKMKSMEEMWQKQMASLQVSICCVKDKLLTWFNFCTSFT